MSYKPNQPELFPRPKLSNPDLTQAVELLKNRYLDPKKKAILQLLVDSYGQPVRQREIADKLPRLGCNVHEKGIVPNEYESTMREVRRIVEQLRKGNRIVICSSRDGYFLPYEQGHRTVFANRLSHEAPARARSSMETLEKVLETIEQTS